MKAEETAITMNGEQSKRLFSDEASDIDLLFYIMNMKSNLLDPAGCFLSRIIRQEYSKIEVSISSPFVRFSYLSARGFH
ncbi:hypothetical protein [Oscillibacter sp.]|uniref:hypothetical protein n=1 Tax=Oscillibacter sp. TaxID=1945593 RepID=UPI0028A5F8AC|nr:hypothetical protein [Oscillibacter sp.]